SATERRPDRPPVPHRYPLACPPNGHPEPPAPAPAAPPDDRSDKAAPPADCCGLLPTGIASDRWSPPTGSPPAQPAHESGTPPPGFPQIGRASCRERAEVHGAPAAALRHS